MWGRDRFEVRFQDEAAGGPSPRFLAVGLPGGGMRSNRIPTICGGSGLQSGDHGPLAGVTAPAAQLPARPMLTSPSGPVRVSRASVRRVPSAAREDAR